MKIFKFRFDWKTSFCRFLRKITDDSAILKIFIGLSLFFYGNSKSDKFYHVVANKDLWHKKLFFKSYPSFNIWGLTNHTRNKISHGTNKSMQISIKTRSSHVLSHISFYLRSLLLLTNILNPNNPKKIKLHEFIIQKHALLSHHAILHVDIKYLKICK